METVENEQVRRRTRSAGSTRHATRERLVEEYLAAVEVAWAPSGWGACTTRTAFCAPNAQCCYRAAPPAALHPRPADPGCQPKITFKLRPLLMAENLLRASSLAPKILYHLSLKTYISMGA
ncbi:jg10413 [Pararge aegeria aegeria]|uniref:Jg10413 protein n=1 Tax=Pararge aegeria aegeria TaxID=348720 RepID=A0A8S4RS23_9NEOP|nr:jg10413 [Pararge aegeria aegeria]